MSHGLDIAQVAPQLPRDSMIDRIVPIQGFKGYN